VAIPLQNGARKDERQLSPRKRASHSGRFNREKQMAMRYAATAVFLMFGAAAYAQDYTTAEYCDPWCTLSYGRDCNYHTFKQCMAASWGTTNSCYSNPFLYLCRRHNTAERASRRHR
jgi:hypothetical protein